MTYRGCMISSERNRSNLLNIQFQLQGLQPGPHSRRSVLDVWPERDCPDERNLQYFEIWGEKENVWPYCQLLDNRNTNLLICSALIVDPTCRRETTSECYLSVDVLELMEDNTSAFLDTGWHPPFPDIFCFSVFKYKHEKEDRKKSAFLDIGWHPPFRDIFDVIIFKYKY